MRSIFTKKEALEEGASLFDQVVNTTCHHRALLWPDNQIYYTVTKRYLKIYFWDRERDKERHPIFFSTSMLGRLNYNSATLEVRKSIDLMRPTMLRLQDGARWSAMIERTNGKS